MLMDDMALCCVVDVSKTLIRLKLSGLTFTILMSSCETSG